MKEKFNNGREDGPTMKILRNGNKAWFYNGKLHRDDGPALETVDGEKYWFKNGVQHRDDGPAFISSNGDKEWWYEGKQYREIEFALAKERNIFCKKFDHH
ncbi:MAG: hypothetical protein IPM20_06365 [Gammaproteobacteria bacterium]|nr:hypothetical protein [Gammaproteobacteria bacterium]